MGTNDMIKTALVIIAAGGMAAVAGCAGKVVTGKVEKGIAARLPAIIGPAQSYHVMVDGSALKLIKGKIPKLVITGTGVRPGGMYYLDRLDVTMTGVQANTETQSLESVEHTAIAAVLTEASLNKYLRQERRDLKDLKIDVQNGKMVVHTRPAVARIGVPVDLTGTLDIQDGTKLRFIVDRLAVAGIKAPGFAVDFVEDRINPVLDIAKFKFPAKIESVVLVNDEIRIDGLADLSKGLPAEGR